MWWQVGGGSLFCSHLSIWLKWDYCYIKNMIMVALMTYGGLTNEEIALNRLRV
jgi:hypothetical protein